MADNLSFLFQGSPPISAPTGSDSSTAFPLWLQQSIFNTIGAAGNLATQPYTPFPGPTVAAPSDATQQAWRQAQSNVGKYQPYMDQAGALTQAGSTPWDANTVSPFLNPYQDYVTAALNRNLQQNVLPGIQDRFIASGQSRSPQEEEMTMRAVRDNQGAIGESLANEYGSATNAALANRSAMLGAGNQYGQLGALSQREGAIDAGQLAASGQSQDMQNQRNLDAAYSSFREQQNWPYQNLSYLSDIIRGLPVQAGGYTTQNVGMTYPSGQYAGSPFNAFLQGSGLSSNNTSPFGFRRGGRVRPELGALSMPGSSGSRPYSRRALPRVA
jgi:hypothetical protein